MLELDPDAGKVGFDKQETKLPTYWNTNFTKICLGMENGHQTNFILMDKPADSLYSLISDGIYRATSLGRDTWKSLIGSEASLQVNCNKEGFNVDNSTVLFSNFSRVRIGLVANEQNDCTSCNSRIGFGGAGVDDDSNTCGNVASRSEPDNGVKNFKVMGYIFVQ